MIVLITSECKIRPSDGFEPRDICIYPFVAGREKAFPPGSGIGRVTLFVHTAAAFPVAGCQEKRPVRLGMPDPYPAKEQERGFCERIASKQPGANTSMTSHIMKVSVYSCFTETRYL